MVADEERVRHVGELLRVERVERQRRRHLVRDDVVHEGRAARARVAEPHHLGGREGDSRLEPGRTEAMDRAV